MASLMKITKNMFPWNLNIVNLVTGASPHHDSLYQDIKLLTTNLTSNKILKKRPKVLDSCDMPTLLQIFHENPYLLESIHINPPKKISVCFVPVARTAQWTKFSHARKYHCMFTKGGQGDIMWGRMGSFPLLISGVYWMIFYFLALLHFLFKKIVVCKM